MEKNIDSELLLRVEQLQQEIAILKQEKEDLEILVQTIVEHADGLEHVLHKEAKKAIQEKTDLEILLETTTEHSDLITAVLQNKAEIAARESERKLAQFLEAVPVGIFVVDAHSMPYYANRMAQQIFGEEIMSNAMHANKICRATRIAHQLLHKGDKKTASEKQQEIQSSPFDCSNDPAITESMSKIYSVYLAGTEQFYPLERQPLSLALQGEHATADDIELRRENKIIPLEVWATPIFDQEGKTAYAIAVFQDITHRKQAEAEKIRYIREREEKNAALKLNAQLQAEIHKRQQAEATLQKANQELARLAALDGLTKIANRRRLDEYLGQEWQRLTRFKNHEPLSFILCDVDHFKLYNDTYGHQAGDDCLRQVAQAISRVVKRPADLVARYGGEEFAVVLPNTDQQGASRVATAIQAEMSALAIKHEKSDAATYITLSIGIATVIISPNRQTFARALIEIADQALYEAKKGGRNCIITKMFVPIH